MALVPGHMPSDFERTCFHSDSINDVPLPEYVTHPRATHPVARRSHIAGTRVWPVMKLF
ncbi:hypothetical protein [Burkholderia territorii]|uniref:hypothetical protein n=1 Tax=Burkholderia territorii TaxID=1503055 RepID=UPI0018C860D2|nr:hypothetical protein [Burkholderia territorii]